MAGYIGSQTPVVSNGSQRKYTFTATAAQTVFTGMDIPNPQQIQVFQNGVRLVITTDYTVSSGTTVTLVNAASAGDSLVVILFADYQLLDQDLSGDFSVDSPTFYVDSTNNRVGVGTATPSTAILDIFTGSTTADGLKINRFATGVYYSTLRQDTHGLAIHVGDGSTISERAAITPNGITFNGDTAAANALDDYEEGTYTANVIDASGNTSSTSATGYYTKVGNFVHVSVYLPNISTAGLVSTDAFYITLPFAGVTNYYGVGSCIADNVTFSSGRTQVNARTSTTADHVIFRGSGSAISDDSVTVSEINSGVTDIFFSVGYRTS